MLVNLGGLELTEGELEDAAVHLHAALQKKTGSTPGDYQSCRGRIETKGLQARARITHAGDANAAGRRRGPSVIGGP